MLVAACAAPLLAQPELPSRPALEDRERAPRPDLVSPPAGFALSNHDEFFAGTDSQELRPHLWMRSVWMRNSVDPFAVHSPAGLWPEDMQTAYGIVPGGGAGVTVAIVDAYDSPAVEGDLNTFSEYFGLPACTIMSGCLTKVDQNGQGRFNRRVPGWEMEINLDVQWVHAIAPSAKILLVLSHTGRNADLMAAVRYAMAHAQIVTMSWGGRESASQTQNDATFAGTPGQKVALFASSGGAGGVVNYPASSPSVIAVGGTNLALNSVTGGVAVPVVETAWSGSGGGCSLYEPPAAAQSSVTFPVPCTNRGTPDVAMAGGPSSAVAIYVSFTGGWHGVYGTSLSSPMWAGLAALADSARGAPLSTSQLMLALYAAPLLNYRDITSGNNGAYFALTGYDFVTGLGSPQAPALIPYLAAIP